MFRKIILSFVGVLTLTSVFGCSQKEKLYVYNWGEYISHDVIKAFEQEYNVNVVYSTFNSNEDMITKLKSESYDVIFPSDYAIEDLSQAGLIQELDWSKLEYQKEDVNADLLQILNKMKDDTEMYQGFDFLKYAVPYFCGTVGITYNTNKVSLTDLENLNWDILLNRNNQYKTAYYDSSRDGFMIPLKQLGYSMNTTNREEILQAKNWLLEMKTNYASDKLAILTDALLDDMIALRYDMAVTYSGDALYVISEEETDVLDFYKPKNGTNIWSDGMAIPKNAKNVEMAYKFIDFMCRFENALLNTQEVGYTSSVNDVYEYCLRTSYEEDDYGYAEYANIYRINIGLNDEMFRYSPENKELTDEEWLNFMVSR